MYQWYKIEGISPLSLRDGQPTEFAVAGKKVGLLKKQDAIHAFSATCPHAGAPLCQGWTDPMGRLVCPLHKYKFDPANGRNTTGEGYKLVTYPLEIRGEELFIGFLATQLL